MQIKVGNFHSQGSAVDSCATCTTWGEDENSETTGSLMLASINSVFLPTRAMCSTQTWLADAFSNVPLCRGWRLFLITSTNTWNQYTRDISSVQTHCHHFSQDNMLLLIPSLWYCFRSLALPGSDVFLFNTLIWAS
jgi:hypothetical protein